MEHDRVLTFSPAHHPNPRVRWVGFELTDPYVEQCWSGVIGPSSTLLLRRMPVLWAERVPAEISASDLGRSIGLGSGTAKSSRVAVTQKRLTACGLVRRAGASDDRHFEVFVEVSPLTPRQLERLPEWTRATHDRLLGAHLDGLGATTEQQARIAGITALLDRLQQPSGRSAGPATGVERALGR
jgi:hypothetical protein